MFSGKVQRRKSFPISYTLRSLGAVILVAVGLRLFIFSSFAMSGVSMLPTIVPGDFLLGSQWDIRDVKRGDIVVLRCPHNQEQMCLKRVVALPGDRVEFKSGKLILNGQTAQYHPEGSAFQFEVIPGVGWMIWPGNKTYSAAPIIVPPDTLYLLNDKRSEMDDSRSWGPVPTGLLEARVRRIWLSLEWFNGTKVRSWPHVRWERMFRSID